MEKITTTSGKTIIFRAPTPDDLEAMTTFARAIEAEDTFILLNPEEPVTDEEEKKHLDTVIEAEKKQTETHIFMVDGSKIVGSCGIKAGGRRKHHLGNFGISILKDYRGEGLGKKLTEITIATAKEKLGITHVYLECIVTNTIAINLYHSLGFVDCGRIPKAIKYKGEYLDEFIMIKEL